MVKNMCKKQNMQWSLAVRIVFNAFFFSFLSYRHLVSNRICNGVQFWGTRSAKDLLCIDSWIKLWMQSCTQVNIVPIYIISEDKKKSDLLKLIICFWSDFESGLFFYFVLVSFGYQIRQLVDESIICDWIEIQSSVTSKEVRTSNGQKNFREKIRYIIKNPNSKMNIIKRAETQKFNICMKALNALT